MKNKQMYAMGVGQPLLNKGFTLIELLAVIVILAIIALIATPIILGIINDVRVGARERSIDNIIHAAEIHYAQEKMKDVNTSNKINIEDIKDKIDGEIPEGGYIIINEEGEAAYSLNFEKENKVYSKSFEGQVVESSKFYYIKTAEGTHVATELFLENPYNITRESISFLKIVPTNKVPSDAVNFWDVTEKEEGENIKEEDKIKAWYYIDEEGKYEIYIGQNGGVKANPNSSFLFEYLTNAKEIDITYLDTSSVTDMSGMFNRCYSITNIDLRNFDTSKVTNLNGVFIGCINLTELDVSNWDTSNVTNMKELFAGGTNIGNMKLERIIGLENFDTNNVTNMSKMFQCCSNLTTLDLRNWNTSSVTDMSSMFYATTNLKPIYIGEKWKTATTTAYMFDGDALTKSVDEMCGPSSTHSYCTLGIS